MKTAHDDYGGFVEKFKPKLTTDDCYTPAPVYDAVRDWAVAEYGLQGRKIVRPFYPGGDYVNYDYPTGCIVIDNPPFSILKQIKDFYNSKQIDFFLFAPHLTMFSAKDGRTNYIVCDAVIAYANGARVNTGFVTNMGHDFIRTAPELKKVVEVASAKARKESIAKLPRYQYPDAVISPALLGKICNVDFRLQRNECSFIRSLESQRAQKKTIFGSGFLISELRAAELRAAELRAAELRAAELRAAEDVIVWSLSDTEKQIIDSLGKDAG